MIRVFIVVEVRVFREGLAQALDRVPGIEIVGTAADPRSLGERCTAAAPDVVLLDVTIPGSLDAAMANGNGAGPTRIVGLGLADDESGVIACAETGVAGCVTREDPLDVLVAAIESAARDEMLCSPRAAAALMRRVRALSAERIEAPSQKLTPRELEIVALIDEGLSNKAIARRLCIEISTVKNHVHNILEKLHVTRRDEAVARVRARAPSRPPRSRI